MLNHELRSLSRRHTQGAEPGACSGSAWERSSERVWFAQNVPRHVAHGIRGVNEPPHLRIYLLHRKHGLATRPAGQNSAELANFMPLAAISAERVGGFCRLFLGTRLGKTSGDGGPQVSARVRHQRTRRDQPRRGPWDDLTQGRPASSVRNRQSPADRIRNGQIRPAANRATRACVL